MATAPIGVDTVTAIASRYIAPYIHDQVYGDNPLTFRLVKNNKKVITGGTHIEVPLMYARFDHGGFYSGFDLLPIAPMNTIKNAVHDWKQLAVTMAVDGLTLIKTDSPEAIANYIQLQSDQANMEMAEWMATGIWSDGTAPKSITGLVAAVDDGTIAATYGGIDRSTNTWWRSAVDSSTTTLSVTWLNGLMGQVTKGGHSPSLIVSGRDQYNRYYGLVAAKQQFNVEAGGHDEQLGSAGFTNLLFNNVPWVVDSHVPTGSGSNTQIFILNERVIDLYVSPRADFVMDPFVEPANQDAMVSKIRWAGELGVHNCQLQAKATAITGV